MKEIATDQIIKTVAELCMSANYDLGEDVQAALQAAQKTETSPVGHGILEQILQNAEIARSESVPICQDTGYAVFFVEIGQDVRITGGGLRAAINEGVRQGYEEGYLRKSILGDPIKRVNTKDNTPALIHFDVVEGDQLKIIIAPKGGGAENMSEVRMLKPSDGAEGVKNFVVERVKKSGGNPCPPVVVGVGIGGTFEGSAILAKKALLRELGSHNPDPFYAAMEDELLERVNNIGSGPQGLGGNTTALGVLIETAPCHIASLPAAVNMQCHAARHKSAVL
ncbi:fumarate hydratase [Candidatus Zixiibacteriota bacterium]